MNTGGQVEAVQESGEPTRDEDASPADTLQNPQPAAEPLPRLATRNPQEVCAEFGSDFVPPAPLDKAAVALATLGQWPLNARRITPERGSCGWYVWGGEGRSSEPGFFQPLHVAHLLERCPQLVPYLALAPGWRVRVAGDAEGAVEIRPPHHVAPPANLTHADFEVPVPRTPPVRQWVWLSIWLHVLAIILFGNTNESGERHGERRGSLLSVSLQGPVERGTDTRDAAPQLRTDTRLSSRDRRPAADTTAAPPATAAEAPAPEPAPPAPAKAAEDIPAVPLLPPLIATEVITPVTTFVVPAAIPEMQTPSPPPTMKLPETIPPVDVFTPPKPAVPPKVEREIALPSQLIPRLATPAPARIEREVAVPIERAPRLDTFVPPKIETETLTPPLALPKITPLAAPLAEREIVRPTELLPRLAPVTTPVEVATPAEMAPRFVPPAVPAQAVAATPPTVAPTTAPASAASAERANEAAPAAATPPTATSPAPARTVPSVAGDLEKSIGKNSVPAGDPLAPRSSVAAPSIAPPAGSTAPRIDLDSVRQRARELAREGSGPRALLPFNVKPKEDTRTKEQQAFDKALKRPDCRDAYAGMGLAAVVPLLWDSVSEKGCKW